MKREDFKEITEKHIESIKKLIKMKGMCENIKCTDCPFDEENNKEGFGCGKAGYATQGMSCYGEDEKLLQSAKEFLEMCERTGALIGEGTVAEDKVNSPKHYRLPGLNIESIDIIRAILGKYFKWFCLGNIIKYILRAEKKKGLEDYKKARKYLDWLIKGEEK